jgi:hypothetical protein
MAQEARHLTAVPTEADYQSFCDTLSATARGRWFLAEYTQRNRNADTAVLLKALDRIEQLVRGQTPELKREHGELRVLLETLRVARTDAEGTAHEKLRAMKLIALVNLLERRIEGMIGAQGAPAAGPEQVAPLPTSASLAVAPPPDQRQLPLLALVTPAPAPAAPAIETSLIDIEIENGFWHPVGDDDGAPLPYDLFESEPSGPAPPESPQQPAAQAAPQPALPDVLIERPDPLAPLRATTDEERLAIFS